MAAAKSRKLTKACGDSMVLQQKAASRNVVFPQHLLPRFHRLRRIGFAPNYPPATLYNVPVRYFPSLSSLSLVQNHCSPLSTTAGRTRVSARAGGGASFVGGDGGRTSPARAHPALSSSPRGGRRPVRRNGSPSAAERRRPVAATNGPPSPFLHRSGSLPPAGRRRPLSWGRAGGRPFRLLPGPSCRSRRRRKSVAGSPGSAGTRVDEIA